MTGFSPHSGGLPRLLIVDGDESHVVWLIDQLLGIYSIHKADRGPELVMTIKTLSPALVILGEDASEDSELRNALDGPKAPRLVHFVNSGLSANTPNSNRCIDSGMSKDALVTQLEIALSEERREPKESVQTDAAKMTAGEAAGVQRLLEVAREFGAQSDLAGASKVLERTLLEFLHADRAHCLFYNADDSSLWTETDKTAWAVARDVSSETGIAGHVARTARTVRASKASADARYANATDDPEGAGDERIIAHPLLDPNGDVHAVLLAVRSAKQEEFSEHDEGICHWLTKQLAPLTAQLAMQLEVAEVLEEAQGQRIFRQEAALAQAANTTSGDVVRVSPPWIGWSYWGLVLVLLGLAVFVCLAEIPDYSSGPVVIRESGRTEVLSPVSGNIENVLVTSGQRIQAGQISTRQKRARSSSVLNSSGKHRLGPTWQTAPTPQRATPLPHCDSSEINSSTNSLCERHTAELSTTCEPPRGNIPNLGKPYSVSRSQAKR